MLLNAAFKNVTFSKKRIKYYDDIRVLIDSDGYTFTSQSIDALFKANADLWRDSILEGLEDLGYEEVEDVKNGKLELWELCKDIARFDPDIFIKKIKLKDKTLYVLSIN